MEIKFIDTITNLLKVLSWQKIVQGTVTMLILGTAYGLWENRVVVYNSLRVSAQVESISPLVIKLSESTKVLMDSTIAKSTDLIVGIQVMNVDFKKNTRSTSYFSFGNTILKESVKDYELASISDIPLFTDKESNNQMVVNLINGEFVCRDFSDTIEHKTFFGASRIVKSVCSISIPPFYGRFTGYMNIYLTKIPTQDEVIFIRQLARDMSLRVYEVDVDKSTKHRMG